MIWIAIISNKPYTSFLLSLLDIIRKQKMKKTKNYLSYLNILFKNTQVFSKKQQCTLIFMFLALAFLIYNIIILSFRFFVYIRFLLCVGVGNFPRLKIAHVHSGRSLMINIRLEFNIILNPLPECLQLMYTIALK